MALHLIADDPTPDEPTVPEPLRRAVFAARLFDIPLDLIIDDPPPDAYWRAFVPWLASQPLRDRVALLQMCVQVYGPAPDDLRPAIEAALPEAVLRLAPMELCEVCGQPTETPPLCARHQLENDEGASDGS